MNKIACARWLLIFLIMIGVGGWLLTAQSVGAAPAQQEATSTPTPQACSECHLDIANAWASSPHAHAFDDDVFQTEWHGHGQPGECLLCHTTGYQVNTNSYVTEGVSCEGCHGPSDSTHPPQVVPVKADTEYCGVCHTTTLSEWRLTGHATAGVGCMDCHEPHTQQALFEVADDMCLNCHKEEMGDYLEDLHIQKGIGCVDCHALVIPPDPRPENGIVPTGHQFTITTQTCVACHTDTLHAGFTLPGYADGARAANGGATVEPTLPTATPSAVSAASTEQQRQVQEATLASRTLSVLFQGALVGLALGGSTMWFLARNTQRHSGEASEQEGSASEKAAA